MSEAHPRTVILALLMWTGLVASAHAADFINYQVSALKAPECITDAAQSFFTQNVQPAEPPHPGLPIGRYYLIVRYLGDDSISAAPTTNFGSSRSRTRGHPIAAWR